MKLTPCLLMLSIPALILLSVALMNLSSILKFLSSPFKMVYQAIKNRSVVSIPVPTFVFRTTVVTAVILLVYLTSTTKFTIVPCHGGKAQTSMLIKAADCGCK